MDPMLTCPICCSPAVELRNKWTYICVCCGNTFNWQYLGAGRWINADKLLRLTELRQGPVLEEYAVPRPLSAGEGTPKLGWKLGLSYDQTRLWVNQCNGATCGRPCC